MQNISFLEADCYGNGNEDNGYDNPDKKNNKSEDKKGGHIIKAFPVCKIFSQVSFTITLSKIHSVEVICIYGPYSFVYVLQLLEIPTN